MAYVTIQDSVLNYFLEWGERHRLITKQDNRTKYQQITWKSLNYRVDLLVYDDKVILERGNNDTYAGETTYEYMDPAFPDNVEQSMRVWLNL